MIIGSTGLRIIGILIVGIGGGVLAPTLAKILGVLFVVVGTMIATTGALA